MDIPEHLSSLLFVSESVSFNGNITILLVKQELLVIPEHLSSPLVVTGFVLTFSFLCSVLYVNVSLFVL